jgi:glycosyltransferase involved in cell wall biosynthesis
MEDPHGLYLNGETVIFRPVRIFLLSPEPPPLGVLRSLTTLGVEPIVARPGGETETVGLVQYVRVASRGASRDPMDLRWSRKTLRSIIRDAGPQLLHIVGDPWTPTAEAGAAAARDLKIPYVLVGTSSVGGAKGVTARWQADRVRNGAAALAGTVRPALSLLAQGRTDVPTAVIPPGGLLIPAAWTPRPAVTPLVFAVVGRLVPERGIDLLLGALGHTYGDWRLRVVGTGPEQEALESQAQTLGLSSRIDWLGPLPREAVTALWADTDAVVAPSRSTPAWVEPSGSIVLEAMAHGVAPVVSRCGALPDVVGDGGMIVAEEDRDALSRAMQGLVADPGLARSIGAAARQRVLEQYGDAAVAERMAGLWKKTIDVKR